MVMTFGLQAQVPTQVVCAVRHTPQGVEEHPVHVSMQGRTIMFRTMKHGQNVWMVFNHYYTFGDMIASKQIYGYEPYFRMKVNRGHIESLELGDNRHFSITHGVAFGMSRQKRQWE